MESMSEQERHENGCLPRDLDPETIALINRLQQQDQDQKKAAFDTLLARAAGVEALRPGRTIGDREQVSDGQDDAAA